MIERVSLLVEALGGRGDPAAQPVLAAVRAGGVSPERLVDALERVCDVIAPERSPIGGSPVLLALSSLLAAAVGGLGLYRLSELLTTGAPIWLAPLAPLPVLLWAGLPLLRRRAPTSRWDARALVSAERELIARGLTVDAAHAVLAYLGATPSVIAEHGAQRRRPVLVAAASALVVVLFWASYVWVITQPILGTE